MSAPLIWDEDEQLLVDSAREWADTEHPPGRFRALRDSGRTWDPALWAELSDLGWPEIGLLGDDGLGLPARAAILEQLGRNLVPTPLLSAWLTADLGLSGLAALAWEEADTRGDVRKIASVVENGRITASKRAVLDIGAADALLVVARGPDGLGAYRVDMGDARITPLSRVDSRDAADIALDRADAEQIADADTVLRAIDHATVGLAAEMLGGMSAAFEQTLAWLKERQQFGVAIGSFQALQHRCVDCFIGIELARSCVIAAAREPTPANVSLAKARCSETYVHVANEAIQFHGGIGMTDEHDIGFFLKRARVAARTFGGAAMHRRRWATLHGY